MWVRIKHTTRICMDFSGQLLILKVVFNINGGKTHTSPSTLWFQGQVMKKLTYVRPLQEKHWFGTEISVAQ